MAMVMMTRMETDAIYACSRTTPSMMLATSSQRSVAFSRFS